MLLTTVVTKNAIRSIKSFGIVCFGFYWKKIPFRKYRMFMVRSAEMRNEQHQSLLVLVVGRSLHNGFQELISNFCRIRAKPKSANEKVNLRRHRNFEHEMPENFVIVIN